LAFGVYISGYIWAFHISFYNPNNPWISYRIPCIPEVDIGRDIKAVVVFHILFYIEVFHIEENNLEHMVHLYKPTYISVADKYLEDNSFTNITYIITY
jgi:hypothetical protein